MMSTHKRSLVKSLVYRGVIFSQTFIILLVITGELMTASGMTIAVQIANMIFYYIYERIWNRITWGRIAIKEKTLTDK